MDKVKHYQAQLDKELSQYPIFIQLENTTGVHKTHLVGGVVAVFTVLIVFNLAGSLLTNLLGWVYPAYASFKAIESPNKDDDKQWLTYWCVVGLFNTVEYFTDYLLYWFPFYFLIKTGFLIWLFLPYTRGAEVIYSLYLRPFMLHHSPTIDAYIGKVQDAASGKRQ